MASEKSNTLYKELLKRGFHEELCKEIAFKYMNTDYTATRMLGYLYRINYLSEESERFRKKHEMEEAQAYINKVYNEGI